VESVSRSLNILLSLELTISIFLSQIFPGYSLARHPISKNSALARIKEKQLELKASTDAGFEVE
jgi:hypothetical protein